MSFDLHLATTCDHQVFRELVLMGDDRRELRLSKPLGASAVKVYASDNLIPSSMYSIVYDDESLTVNQPRMIRFKEKWRSPNDTFEVTYVTLVDSCPKCDGREALDDISYTVKGGLRQARDEILLLQNAEKWTITEIKSNPFHTFIGTSLVTLLGERITDVNFLVTKVTGEINNTLQKFTDLQNQYRLTNRSMTDGEILETIENVEVDQDDEDPTILRATVTIRAASGKSVDYEQALKLV